MHHHPLHSAVEGSLGLRGGVDSPPQPCPFFSLPRHLPVSCLQSCVPQPAPGTHSHHSVPQFASLDALVNATGRSRGCLHVVNPWWKEYTGIYSIPVGSGWQGFSTTFHAQAWAVTMARTGGNSHPWSLGQDQASRVSCFLPQDRDFV